MIATIAEPLAGEGINEDDILFFEMYQPPTPSYEKANRLSFYTLCTRLEIVWEQSQKDSQNKKSKQTLLEFLLPQKLHQYLEGGSPYPLLRLLMPDYDTERAHSGMKEKTIASTWASALGLNKQSEDYRKLHNYNNPLAAKRTMSYGDLSIVVQEVIAKRSFRRENPASKVTIGMMNRYLDDLGRIRSQSVLNTKKNANIRNNHGPKKSNSGKTTLQVQRETWVKRLFSNKLSPLEHKWLVRIILQKIDIGIGSDGILGYYHPWASKMYDVNKDLCKLCATLSDPIYIRKKKAKIQTEVTLIEQRNRLNYMPTSTEVISIGNVLNPALSRKTLHRSFLTDISERHRRYIDTLPADSPLRSCLSLKFPSFVCEAKMDGERMITHVINGVLYMHTRQGNWYTNVYAPILGPAVREALAKYKVDVIIDGEIIAWDDCRKEVIPFGFNRAVAKYRREWCQRNGKLADIDMPKSERNDASNVMNIGYMYEDLNIPGATEENGTSSDAGKNCWLKYVVFDIIYVGGTDASKLITDACYKRFKVKEDVKGSIINFPLCQRKAILYQLLTPIENFVEPIECLVVRSDGQQMEGKKYFLSTSQEDYGVAPLVLDSIHDTIEGSMMSLNEHLRIDLDRRRRRTDNEIHDERASRVQEYFHETVDKRRQEGTIFKDLASPYAPGASFRKEGYWFKLKLDYDKLGGAADLDFIVLGAYFATGMRNVGFLSSFLLGCIDDSERRRQVDKYLTVSSISAGGVSREHIEKLMEQTGFRRGTSRGKWFEVESGQLPHFISSKSFQRSMLGDNSGWKYNARLLPNLWISPKDSFVLTVNAAEIVVSDDHSAGISLRFPRIDRIRAEGFPDPKPISDIVTVSELHERYKEKQQSNNDNEGNGDGSVKRTFLSVHEYDSSFKNRKRQRLYDDPLYGNKIINAVTVETNFFSGFSFLVLEGTYGLDDDSIDSEEAKFEGWYPSVSKVSSQQDVILFIKRNGGSVSLGGIGSSDMVIGGRLDDARVSNYQRAAASSTVVRGKSKAPNKSENLPLFNGVLKWTFIFREKYKGFLVNKEDAYFDLSIIPRKDDFLFMNTGNDVDIDTRSYSELSPFDFKRILISIPSSSTTIIPWQRRGFSELNDDEKVRRYSYLL